MSPPRYYYQKLRDLALAGFLKKFSLDSRVSQSPVWLNNHRDKRLKIIVEHALHKSPFYKKQLKGINLKNFCLEDIPILTKETMMSQYDDFTCDRRLKLKFLNRHLDSMTHDIYYHNKYKIFRSGGSSGIPTLMAYNWREFAHVLAQIMRSSKTAVNLPKNRRLRGANIYARNPTHDSIRISQSFQVGFHIVQDMAADMPLKEMVKLLNQFNPDILSGFPSVICELAQEKLEKRLLIRPQVIFLGSEPLSSEMREIIRKGFGIDPHDHYGTTEAIVMANECPKHLGMHLEDDMHIIEVVDQNNQPVSHGEMGHKILVTNLYAFTQPIIRYELSDMIELDSHTGLCPCGRTFRRIKRIMGRNEDLFYFQNNLDKQVVISHEDLQQAMSVCQNVRQYQIIRRENEILVKALLHDATLEHQTKDQIIKVLSAVMQNMQVKLGRISCEFTDHLERKSHSTQKFRQIWCEKD